MALKAIVVEDKAGVAEHLCGMLRDLGHDVRGSARTAADLAALMTDYHPDLVVIDLDLGERQDGIGVATLLEAGGPLPVVFVVNPDEEKAEVEESRSIECSATLQTPFTPKTLQHAIERAIGRAKEAADPKL